jgi:cobalt-zinc-cadmium efflux system outer membrane protein
MLAMGIMGIGFLQPGCRQANSHATYMKTIVPRHATDTNTEDLLKQVSATKETPSTAPPLDKQNLQDPNNLKRFTLPAEIPGAKTPALKMPQFDQTATPAERKSLVESLFPEVPKVGATTLNKGTNSSTIDLAILQGLAFDHSPLIQQSIAEVDKARGKAIQAGLYPNPTVGYEGDTLGTARTWGYNGVYVEQEFVTAGKLSYARSSAMMEMQAASCRLKKARITLANNVRRGYFNVLIAQEQLRLNQAISKLSDEVYKAQIDLVVGGESAPYEPLQLRVFAVQARNAVILAENSLQSNWRELAATLGMPMMEYQPVEGDVTFPVPDLDYHQAINYLMCHHTDLAAAKAMIASAQYDVRYQELKPIPNINVYAALQKDDTTPLSDVSSNIQVGVPVPLYNRNQGNIQTSQAQLIKSHQDYTQTQNELMASFANAYNRYSNNRVFAESYRSDLLGDQVKVYRGVYDRFRVAGDQVDFAQVVVTQQNLVALVNSYFQVLKDQWMATIDVAELLQVDDLMTMDKLVGTTLPAEVPPAIMPTPEPIIDEQKK